MSTAYINHMKTYDVVVIGGGPAGIMAAATAAARDKSVLLLEKNDTLGRKLRITGKGRCNITNAADISSFIGNINTNASFLYSAFYSFTNTDLIDLFHSLGVDTKIERGERVFPQSDSANEVADALIGYAKRCKVEILVSTSVKKIIIENNAVEGVITNDGTKILSRAVIVATGGVSYPQTGSTGDGYKFAKGAGHTVESPKPSLIPLVTCEDTAELMGLSLKNVGIKIIQNGVKKPLYTDFGEMLFTHFGVSGPIILSAGAHIKDFSKEYTLVIDLKPALTTEQLDKRIQRDFIRFVNKNFSNALDELLPQKLIPFIISLSGIAPDYKVNQITKAERVWLVTLLKELKFTIIAARPVQEAIITAGGVCVNEINSSTMESKLTQGLYFSGEVIDVDGYTGGYNLQIAFSTGYAAGMNI